MRKKKRRRHNLLTKTRVNTEEKEKRKWSTMPDFPSPERTENSGEKEEKGGH